MAADILRIVYDQTNGTDGFVSFELPPEVAHDTEKSISEARRLWKEVDRPNVMLKVPATSESSAIIENLISEGINVNITLIFSVSQYETVAKAYMRGLERCQNPEKIASVASFFLSRIDNIIDKKLEIINTPNALSLRGKIAVSIAKMAYAKFKEVFNGKRWLLLAQRGGKAQRLLWASTGTKNPAYSDVLYIEALIGPETVNTIPPKTATAFKDHGKAKSNLQTGFAEAQKAIREVAQLGIDLNAVADDLQIEGLKAFADSYSKLLSTLEQKQKSLMLGVPELRVVNLGKYQSAVNARLADWEKNNFMKRIWAKDPTLWFSEPTPEITNRLGWLFLPETMHEQLASIVTFAEEIKAEGMTHIVLLGMGGSSLAPEVFQKTFGNGKDYPELIVLDSTHPNAIKNIEKQIDLNKTLFVVSSKSGTTLDTMSLFKYFWEKMESTVKNRWRHFIAISDPDTPLIKLATERGFRRVFPAVSDVGGRYSALTVFGLVPAALIGVDVYELLDKAQYMVENCAFCVTPQSSYGLRLGAVLGELAKVERNKVTFFASSSVRSFPVWLEQLIAESTGKDGKGIIPIVDEPLAAAKFYGKDRVFVIFAAKDDKNEFETLVKELEEAGHPTIWITLIDKTDLSQEIFCWEMAVASVGAILGINPFNQPDVEMAKEFARQAMRKTEGIANNERLETIVAENKEALSSGLEKWVNKAVEGDYVAIQAYLPTTTELTDALQKIRTETLSSLNVSTTLGYGPRFLHSTGQLHKGGPNTGLFLQLVDEIEEDLEVPETDYSFGKLIAAEAIGDYQALKHLGRRVLRVNIKRGSTKNISVLAQLIYEQIALMKKEEDQK